MNCEYLDSCSDMKKLIQSQIMGEVDENLADQYFELCSNGAALKDGTITCSLWENYRSLENKIR